MQVISTPDSDVVIVVMVKREAITLHDAIVAADMAVPAYTFDGDDHTVLDSLVDGISESLRGYTVLNQPRDGGLLMPLAIEKELSK